MRYEICEKVPIEIYREEANFDRACDAAKRMAIGIFEVDKCGHIGAIEDSERSTDYIVIKLDQVKIYGGILGWSHEYLFLAYVERAEEDEDDDS